MSAYRSLEHHHLGNWPSSDEEVGESAVEMPSIGPSLSPLTFNTFGLRKTSSFGILSRHRDNPLLSAARALIGPLSTSGSASKAHLTTEHRYVDMPLCAPLSTLSTISTTVYKPTNNPGCF